MEKYMGKQYTTNIVLQKHASCDEIWYLRGRVVTSKSCLTNFVWVHVGRNDNILYNIHNKLRKERLIVQTRSANMHTRVFKAGNF